MNLSVAGYWEFCFDALGCQFLEKGKEKGGGQGGKRKESRKRGVGKGTGDKEEKKWREGGNQPGVTTPSWKCILVH